MAQRVADEPESRKGSDVIQELSPAYAAAFEALAAVPRRAGGLSEKDRELINLSLNVSVTHLNKDETRACIARAARAGAIPQEICEVVQLASVLGIHGLTSGIRVLAELADTHPAVRERLESQLDPRQQQLKADFIAGRGYWSPVWDVVIRFSPDFFEAYYEFSSVPWRSGVVDPKLKELIYVAIDTSATHMYNSGTKVHMINALGYGATVDEIMQVLELSALMGFQSAEIAYPHIEALAGRK